MTRDYKGERVIIYPAYLDSTLPRRLGRRVPKDEGVPKPTLREIARAAEKLGLDPVIEADSHYPRTWFTRKGRVIVRKKGESKTSLLRRLAREVASQRRSQKK